MPVLFNREDFSSYTDRIKNDIKEEINNWDKEYIMKIETEKYCDYLISKYSIEPISAFFDKKELTLKETETNDKNFLGKSVMVPATQYTLIIPFEGNSEYFFYIPNPRRMTRDKEGVINGNELHISFIISDYSRSPLEREIKDVIEYVDYHVTNINKNVNSFNKMLGRSIKWLILKRKEKLSKIASVANALNIPIRPRKHPISPLELPIRKKKIKIELPEIPKTEARSYRILEYEMYENILEVCFNISTVMERTPETYKNMPEESIRDLFLAHLNGHFEGGVSGETFNKKGKTDILIQVKNDIIFVGECKIWDGEKVMLKTIDQLFGYITWRETKAAIFIFNKDRKITTVLNKIDGIMKKHNNFSSGNCLKSEKLNQPGVYSYIFKHPDDKNIMVYLTILVFNLNIS